MRKLLVAGLCALAIVALEPPAFAAVPGPLDGTFSGDGAARSALLSNYDASFVQVDSNNRVIVGGYDANLDAPLVIRYKANGAIDRTWGNRYLPGSQGVVGVSLFGAKTLVGLRSGRVVRLTSQGALDKTFATAGVLDLPVELIAFGSNASGVSYAIGEYNHQVSLLRIPANGKSFSTTAVCIGARFYDPTCGAAESMTVSPTFVYVGGSATVAASDSAVVGRFKANGHPDTTYGSQGYGWFNPNTSITNPGEGDGSDAAGVAVSPSTGEVTFVGNYCTGGCPHDHSYAARFDSTGHLIPRFTTDVYFGDSLGGDSTDSFPAAVALQSGMTVIVGRDSYCEDQHAQCFGIERLTGTGAVDPTFISVGHTALAPSAATSVRVFNTKIVVAGGQYVARYLG